MLSLIFYYIFLFINLIFAFSLCAYMIGLLFSALMGAPYVATANKRVQDMLQNIDLKPGDLFVELGCGDGRVVRTAVKDYKMKGKGLDINPLLIWYARLWAKMQKINNIEFSIGNIFKTNLSQADVVYLFLFPELIKKLESQFNTQLKNNALIISHGFKIPYYQQFLIKTLAQKPFPTYYYRIDQAHLTNNL